MSTAQNNDTPLEPNNNEAPAPAAPKVPDWIKAELFEELMKENVPNFKKILDFNAFPALAAGENYATMMLRVEIEAELEAGKRSNKSFMLKVPNESEFFSSMSMNHNIFTVESAMYAEIVPDFEKLYRDAGVEVTFGAKFYKLNTEKDHILLEDLRPRDFKNMNRLEGLDMEHAKCVLRKLAQWHAASAVRYQTKGKYNDNVALGFFVEELRPVMEQMGKALSKPFLACFKTYKDHELYLESALKVEKCSTDHFFSMIKLEPNDFHVLNHGDCWANNIMFQHDDSGKVKETYLVDYQVPHYGSPAQDLLYFLVSSTQLDIKVKEFDYFIRYYHEHLVEYLTLLKYDKKLPTLREIHITLIKNGLWGYMTVSGVMAVVLVDPSENATFDNFLGETEAGLDFKMLMYSGKRYRQHIELLLPWLYNRGALEC